MPENYRNVKLAPVHIRPASINVHGKVDRHACDRLIAKALRSDNELLVPYTAGVIFEHLLRHWLFMHLPLIKDRGLDYEAFSQELRDYGDWYDGWYDAYDEIDALVGEDNTPRCLVEIRCSCHRMSQLRVTKDLLNRLEIARTVWPDVTGMTITVRTGPWRYRRQPASLTKRGMKLDRDLFWRMVEQGENQFIVVDLPDLQMFALSLGVVLPPEFLDKVHEFGINNFIRKKNRLFELMNVARVAELPSCYPWSFAPQAAL